MNYSRAVFLINDDVRCLEVTYETGEKAVRTQFKTLDKTIKVDDFVIVPTDTRHGMTVVKVVKADVDVDLDSTVQMNWIIGRIELHNYNEIVDMEREAIETIKSAEKRKKRDEMRAAIFRDQSELQKLALTSLKTVDQIEVK